MQPAVSRRTFLRTAAVGAMIVPAYVVGRGDEPPPSERLQLAAIGCGGKGWSDLQGVAPGNRIVALCDADQRHTARAKTAHPEARTFTDFRRMFDAMADDIDGVTVTTPDHMHFAAALWAIRRGKHVLVQKPLVHTMEEARRLTEAARKYKVVSKMGNQGQATEDTRRLVELLRGGAIGTVKEIHIWTDRPIWLQGGTVPPAPAAVPEFLDWKAWIGSAPERPFAASWPPEHAVRSLGSYRHEQVYHPFVWRGWWDFGTGALGDIACHSVNPVFWALFDLMSGPFSVEAETAPFNDQMYPEWSIVTYRFPRPDPQPDLKFVWYDGGKMPPRPELLEAERPFDSGNGSMYIGDQGTMLGTRLIPEARMQEYAPRAPKPSMPRSPGHYEEWLAAIKGAPRVDNSFDHSGPLTEMVLAGNVAIRTRTKLDWDPRAFRFTNHDDANQWVKKTYQSGYEL